jgi:hypothetical protein
MFGAKQKSFLDNPFVRWHSDIHEYPDHHSDYDDLHMTQSDEFERRKPFKSNSKAVKGETNLVTHKDDDEKMPVASVTGENCFTHPFGSNRPVIDHGIDEEDVWNFPKNLYNQNLVPNPFLSNPEKQSENTDAPWWGKKLAAPVFFRDHKFQKLLRQQAFRKELTALQREQVDMLAANPSKENMKLMESQTDELIKNIYKRERDEVYLKDVYVTDHKAEDRKVLLADLDEAEKYQAYKSDLDSYHQKKTKLHHAKKSKYPRGSILQRMLDPFATAVK